MSGRNPTLRFVLPLVISVTVVAPVVGQSTELPREDWYAIYLQGAKVGHVYGVVSRDPKKGAIRSVTRMELTVKRLGQSVTSRVTTGYDESDAGKILGFHLDTKSSVIAMKVRGTIKGDKLLLATGENGSVQERPWDDSVIGPYAGGRLLASEAFKPGLQVMFDTFSLEAFRKTTVRVDVKAQEDVEIMGKQLRLWRVEMSQDVMPGLTVTSWIDENANVFKSRALLMGMVMDQVKCAREQALSESESPDLFKKHGVVKVKRRVRRPRKVREAAYRIELENPAALKANIEDERQTIVGREGNRLVLRVHVKPGPVDGKAKIPDGFEKYTRSTMHVQSDDPKIQAATRRAGGAEKDPWKRTKRLERWVYNAIREKSLSVGFAGARETLETREGDCSEHAVLLAAMLRASGIPSKVAYGLIYFDEPRMGGPVFGAHMWTEAWVGRWIALDATLAKPFVDAMHVKLGDSALDTPGLGTEFLNLVHFLGQMSIEILRVGPKTSPG